MATPTTVDEFLDMIRKSGVIDEKRIDTYIQDTSADGGLPEEPSELARVLIRDGILTRFQAEQFLQGKWRRFTIGNFKVLERLGSGGMGNVYLCEHKMMRHRVAIKVLATVSAENPEAIKRFYREARAAAVLDHPNIVRAHDVGKEDKLHFLVMEYVDGTSLEEIVKKHGRMDVLRATHYIYQSALGLQYAHETGLVHRDVKPANLILDRTGVVKVLDMGVARFSQEEDEVLTKGPLGTADYLSPEQARDSHAADHRADIYGLGATFYCLVIGHAPFPEGKTVAQKLMMLQTKRPTPVQELRPEIPQELSAIIDKMMAKEVDQRYQTLADVILDLEPWTQTLIGPPPDKEMPHLSPALQGNEATEVGLATTPGPSAKSGPGSGGLGRKKAPEATGNSGTKLKDKPGTPQRNGNQKPMPAEHQGRTQSSLVKIIAITVSVTVLIFAGVVAGLWWFLIRNAH